MATKAEQDHVLMMAQRHAEREHRAGTGFPMHPRQLRKFMELVHPERRPKRKALVGNEEHATYPNIRRQGRQRWQR